MRKRLSIFCAITALLTAIAFIPGILVIAAFLGGLPAVILAVAPDALMVGATLLIVDILSPRRQSSHKGPLALGMSGLLLTLALGSARFNRPIEKEVQALTQEDHDLRGTLPASRDVAIRFVTNGRARNKSQPVTPMPGSIRPRREEKTPTAIPSPEPGVIPPPERKQFCERLCLHLLLDGLADNVIVIGIGG